MEPKLDPAAADPLMLALAWIHPVLMILVMSAGVYGLLQGMALGNARRRRQPKPPGTRERHLKATKPALVVGLVGALLGPVSSVAFRDWAPMATAHGYIAGGAVVLGALTFVVGRGLEREGTRRQLHGAVGFLTIALGAAAVLSGLELLP